MAFPLRATDARGAEPAVLDSPPVALAFVSGLVLISGDGLVGVRALDFDVLWSEVGFSRGLVASVVEGVDFGVVGRDAVTVGPDLLVLSLDFVDGEPAGTFVCFFGAGLAPLLGGFAAPLAVIAVAVTAAAFTVFCSGSLGAVISFLGLSRAGAGALFGAETPGFDALLVRPRPVLVASSGLGAVRTWARVAVEDRALVGLGVAVAAGFFGSARSDFRGRLSFGPVQAQPLPLGPVTQFQPSPASMLDAAASNKSHPVKRARFRWRAGTMVVWFGRACPCWLPRIVGLPR